MQVTLNHPSLKTITLEADSMDSAKLDVGNGIAKALWNGNKVILETHTHRQELNFDDEDTKIISDVSDTETPGTFTFLCANGKKWEGYGIPTGVMHLKQVTT